MSPVELQRRTKQFALRCLKVADSLPENPGGRAIARQLARAATLVAANYRASCRSRTHREFIAKIGVVAEEADESAFWLELATEGGYLPCIKITPLQGEANELTAIFAASHITAMKRASSTGERKLRNNRPSAITNPQS